MQPQAKSSGTVLPFVGVACLGAILFGYHLGYGSVNVSNFIFSFYILESLIDRLDVPVYQLPNMLVYLIS